jgi:hypothetical protein
MPTASSPATQRRFLGQAIQAYERGMALDLNDYPTSNLPRLYRRRGAPDDARRAIDAATVATAACRASLARNADDPWARPTMLTAAFDAGDPARAREIVEEIREAGAVRWRLETTVDDLRDSLSLHGEPDVRSGLAAVLAEVEGMVER